MKWQEKYYNDKIVLDWFYQTKNFGDYLNKWMLEKMTGKEVVHVSSNYDFSNTEVYACIGSVLQKKFKYPMNIWGAGAMYSEVAVYNIKKVHAVRGVNSRKVLLKHNIECPETYGDPAILLPMFYLPEAKKKTHTIGLLPHYIDHDTPWVNKYKDEDDVKFIDICAPIEQVIEDITSCCYIISSSLHGLIAADAYDTPTVWVEFSDKVRGNGFKFRDYYSGIGYESKEPINLREDSVSLYQVEKQVRRDIKISLETQAKLWASCPFNKEKK